MWGQETSHTASLGTTLQGTRERNRTNLRQKSNCNAVAGEISPGLLGSSVCRLAAFLSPATVPTPYQQPLPEVRLVPGGGTAWGTAPVFRATPRERVRGQQPTLSTAWGRIAPVQRQGSKRHIPVSTTQGLAVSVTCVISEEIQRGYLT